LLQRTELLMRVLRVSVIWAHIGRGAGGGGRFITTDFISEHDRIGESGERWVRWLFALGGVEEDLSMASMTAKMKMNAQKHGKIGGNPLLLLDLSILFTGMQFYSK
jgi:hypothetical protein